MRHVFARLRSAFRTPSRLPAPEFRARVWQIGTHRASLGENPRWRRGDAWVHWLDVHAGEVRGTRLADGTERSWKVGDVAGAMAIDDDGALIVAVEHRLLRLDPKSGRSEPWRAIASLDVAKCRTNDMAWGPSGELLVATMDLHGREPLGALIALDADGGERTLRGGVRIGNGPAVDRDRRVAYFADSPTGMVYRVSLDGASDVDSRDAAPHITIASEFGVPDGMVVASDGELWIAHYDGGCLSCWSPAGELLGWIRMPVKRPTALALLEESPSLRMAVTSAMADDDDGGGLWLVERSR